MCTSTRKALLERGMCCLLLAPPCRHEPAESVGEVLMWMSPTWSLGWHAGYMSDLHDAAASSSAPQMCSTAAGRFHERHGFIHNSTCCLHMQQRPLLVALGVVWHMPRRV